MFTIVGEAPIEVRVGVDCTNCKISEQEGTSPSSLNESKKWATLFFSEETKSFITCCSICGITNKDEELVMESYTQCQSCEDKIKIKDIRESVPCESCGEINNRVVAITRYYSRIPVK